MLNLKLGLNQAFSQPVSHSVESGQSLPTPRGRGSAGVDLATFILGPKGKKNSAPGTNENEHEKKLWTDSFHSDLPGDVFNHFQLAKSKPVQIQCLFNGG